MKKGIFTEARSIPGSRMILLDQASGERSNVNTFCKFRFLYFVEWYIS